jgi:hypothetical protein
MSGWVKHNLKTPCTPEVIGGFIHACV